MEVVKLINRVDYEQIITIKRGKILVFKGFPEELEDLELRSSEIYNIKVGEYGSVEIYI